LSGSHQVLDHVEDSFHLRTALGCYYKKENKTKTGIIGRHQYSNKIDYHIMGYFPGNPQLA
jgi:hypothetical protein